MSSALKGRRMRRLPVILAIAMLAISAAGCGGGPRKSAAAPERAKLPAEMRTIDSVDVRPVKVDPPPMVTDIGPAPKPKANVAQANALPPPTPADEALRNALPFAPAIAMDPVDGSKISIRATTSTVEYKGHIYYFDSEANKRTFLSNPEQFTKGLFSHL
jgi:YHS domain-containing protein